MLLFAVLLASMAFAMTAVTPAHADDVNTDKYQYVFSGNVKYNDKPLAGVEIDVSGNGYSATVKTDEKGQWSVGVPEKKKYDITLVESTLPKGVIVSQEGNDRLTISEKGATIEAEFGLTDSKSVNFFLGQGVRETVSFFDQFVSRAINGLNFGLMLALAAIGLSLVFGTTGIANFAHAEMVTFGALMALTFSVILVWPIWIAFPLAVILTGVLGWLQDVALWKPLRIRGLSIVQLMIVSIGFSLALRYVFQYFYGGRTYQLPDTGSKKIQLLGPIALSVTDMVSMGISIVMLLLVAYWLQRTKIGKATRAIADNSSLAATSGIDVDRVVRIVWIFGSALAGLSGILWAYFRPGIKWDMGWQILLLIFAAVVLGGLGTAYGALVGSIIVGLLVELSTLWIPSDVKYVGPFVVLIIVLLVRPQGLLGRRERIG
ncbi:MAG: branched-chain amino acid ABC transporter permease [Cryobacterium sp.]|nr:branched-chain amino acid ABC transporter permease [Micrococcales bacterium]MBX3077682.1 branched-chain amino acid ABC transporter permease [Cryobacterium sp.]MBX3310227.1 branched-chain amino acid ABC transporter permease [Cryobacterium sp.]MCB1279898.1 branched-chain amino acid ABC transporter permease [Salinibacterium sp.]